MIGAERVPREHVCPTCAHCRVMTDANDRAEKAEAEVQRLRAGIDALIEKLTEYAAATVYGTAIVADLRALLVEERASDV